jgi:hypothetical protein
VPTAMLVLCAPAIVGCAQAVSNCGFVYTLRTPSGTSHQGSCAGQLATVDFAIRRAQTFEFKSVTETAGKPLLPVPVSDDPAVVAVVAVHGQGNATYRAFTVGEGHPGNSRTPMPSRSCCVSTGTSRCSSVPMCPVLHVRVAP